MINKFYLNREVVESVRNSFWKNSPPSIHLHNFLDEDSYKVLKKELRKTRWKKSKEVLTHSYKKSNLSKNIQKILKSQSILEFLSKILNKKVKNIEAELFCFEWKDYTILNDLKKESENTEFILDLTENWKDNFGGKIVYTKGLGEGLIIPVKKNSLLLLKKDSKIRKFIKYVNNNAGKNKRIILIGKTN